MADVDTERFGGIGRLYGTPALGRLAAARVCIVGIGGVGSWTVEALARSGVGHLTLVDLDDVCVTNTNRQLHALSDTVGRSKTQVMAERVASIAPGTTVEIVDDFVTANTVDALLDRGFDQVVDAIDQARNKILLALGCRARGIGLVTCGGAGGRRDPMSVRVDDLNRTEGDGLLRKVRRELRRAHGWDRQKPWRIAAVYSAEVPTFVGADGELCERPEPGTSTRLDCASGFGTASFVTGAFGLAAAGVVVSRLAA